MCAHFQREKKKKRKEEKAHPSSSPPLQQTPDHSSHFCLFNLRGFVSMKGGTLGPLDCAPAQGSADLLGKCRQRFLSLSPVPCGPTLPLPWGILGVTSLSSRPLILGGWQGLVRGGGAGLGCARAPGFQEPWGADCQCHSGQALLKALITP